jgi:hypothetical protein
MAKIPEPEEALELADGEGADAGSWNTQLNISSNASVKTEQADC